MEGCENVPLLRVKILGTEEEAVEGAGAAAGAGDTAISVDIVEGGGYWARVWESWSWLLELITQLGSGMRKLRRLENNFGVELTRTSCCAKLAPPYAGDPSSFLPHLQLQQGMLTYYYSSIL